MPSEYETDRVFRLTIRERGDSKEWRLRTEVLRAPFRKRYDDGTVDEWAEANEDAGAPEDLSFLAACIEGVPRALATWRVVEWNRTLWLVDIRADAAWRRSGLASALLTWLQSRAKELGLRGITVETQSTNYPAVSFYRARGFRLSGLHESLYSNEDVESGEVALFLFCPVA